MEKWEGVGWRSGREWGREVGGTGVERVGGRVRAIGEEGMGDKGNLKMGTTDLFLPVYQWR